LSSFSVVSQNKKSIKNVLKKKIKTTVQLKESYSLAIERESLFTSLVTKKWKRKKPNEQKKIITTTTTYYYYYY